MTHAVDGARVLVLGGNPGGVLAVAAALALFDAAMLALAVRAARQATA
ncbi:MAG: hypothetical protein IRZ18_08050 [Clostridia bacterium]|nr:hypothetical protein [Clostridia bacterium]